MKNKFWMENKRYIGSLIVVPIIIALLLSSFLLKAVMFVITIISLIEFSNALKNEKININKYLIIIFTIIYYIVGFRGINTLVLLALVILLAHVLSKDYNIIDISLNFMFIFYIVIPFSFICILSDKNSYLPWIIFLCAWTTDTMAYFIGKNFGKHKLLEKISPNKTVEGFLGGIVSCCIVIPIYGMVFYEHLNISLVHLVILSICISIIGQVGDLIASSIKRLVGIKDFSNLIPGHGGVLDRFDSILLISIVVFIYSQIFM